MAVVFELKSSLEFPLDLSCFAVESSRVRGPNQLAALHLPYGNESIPVGELFSIHGDDDSSEQTWMGDLRMADGLGAGMLRGQLICRGSVGHRAGAHMKGGRVVICEDAGNGLGTAMTGGEIFVAGNAGDRVGAAETPAGRGMNGGLVLVCGDVGELTGFRMRRGTIVIGGSVPVTLGLQMLAGTIISRCGFGPQTAAEMRRGTLVGLEPSTPRPILPGFRYSGEFELQSMEMLLKYARLGLDRIPESCLESFDLQPLRDSLENSVSTKINNRGVPSRWAMYYGDHLHGGKGEILIALEP